MNTLKLPRAPFFSGQHKPTTDTTPTTDKMADKPQSLRILQPFSNIYAYYDGRTGERFHSNEPNWLDDGAFTLGIASYSVISENEAIIFDAHITADHARAVTQHLRDLGISRMTVVYSHAHTDHIAGAESFKDFPIIASHRAAVRLAEQRRVFAALDPPVHVVLPTRTFDKNMSLRLGNIEVQLHSFNIHTHDSIVLWVPSQKVLLAGDTLEDTATYIAEPGNLAANLKELRRMASTFSPASILPAHGDPARIAAGGYNQDFIDSTIRYLIAIDQDDVDEPPSWSMSLAEVVAADVAAGTLIYYKEYERVHKENIEKLRNLRQKK